MTLAGALHLMLGILPLYLLAGLGYAAGRGLQINSRDLGRVALYFITPAVVFLGFYTVDVSAGTGVVIGLVFVLVTAMGVTAAWLAERLVPGGPARLMGYGAASGNTGFFGIPACMTILGAGVFDQAVIVSFGTILFEVTVGFYLIGRSFGGVREALLRVARFPALHGAWLGLACNVLDVPIEGPVQATLNLLRGAYTPLGMMLVGLGLSGLVGKGFDARMLGFMMSMRMLVFPALAFVALLVEQATLDVIAPITRQVVIIQALTPVAAATVIHATVFGIEPAKAAIVVALSTALALITLPVGYFLLASQF